ncbi:MAG: twin-arginine translocase subunit TatB [Myxococcales bacterium]|nr:twin-arginine translocase subunit TatB [Myxococcales bacterium]
MFGLDFGELIVIAIVFLVVLGPQELPRLMRNLGRWVTKLRRMSNDLRQQSGIDEVIRAEGLQKDLQTLRGLSRPKPLGALLGVEDPLRASDLKPMTTPVPAASGPKARRTPDEPPLEREYPVEGPDAYGARHPPPPRASAEAQPAPASQSGATLDPYAPDEPAAPTAPAAERAHAAPEPAEDQS